MKQKLRETLKTVLDVAATAGWEYPLTGVIAELCRPYADEVTTDPYGDLICRVKKEGKPKLVLCAHMDQVGFWIRSITADGFLYFALSGETPQKILEASRVTINGNIPGVIGMKPGHLQTPEEQKTPRRVEECYIDIGARSAAQVRALGIEIGSTGVFDGPMIQLADPDMICAAALDDRAGCAVLIELLKNLDRDALEYDLFVCFTVQEETGLKGGQAIGNFVEPDYAVALDTIPAGDVPDVSYERQLPIRLGEGVAIVLAEGLNNINYTHAKMKERFFAAAKAGNIPVQPVSMLGFGYATDAVRLANAGRGVTCGTLAIPRRNSHSPVEIAHMGDLEAAHNLLAQLIRLRP